MSGRVPILIPLVFRKEPDQLHRDLERLASTVKAYADDLDEQFSLRPKARRTLETNGTVYTSFDRLTRVAPATTQTINLILPQPDVRETGRSVGVVRTIGSGTVNIYSPGCLVNGTSGRLLDADVGYSTFIFDSENYYGDKPHTAL